METVTHKHHLLPRHVVRWDAPINLVLCSIPEHAEYHRYLWETFNHYEDYVAWKWLSGLPDQEGVRELQRAAMVKRRGVPQSKEWVAKRTAHRKRRVATPCKGCGQPFFILPCELGARRFCSQTCYHRGRVGLKATDATKAKMKAVRQLAWQRPEYAERVASGHCKPRSPAGTANIAAANRRRKLRFGNLNAQGIRVS